eukprot:1198213-Ditylum_brightwellii.AAC.1
MGKQVGNNKINRTRILSIYKADYSVFIGLMWKALLSSSEKRGTLNRGLYGVGYGHNAQTLSLIEEIKYDICFCSRKSLFNFDNDAASCYDWILHNVTSLVAKKKGLHKNVTFVYNQMLEQAKYKLKTALGVSKEYYQHCTTLPIYGSGQGATNSLGIWLTISSTIGDIYEQSSNGTELISLDKAIVLVLAILGFMDDVTNQVNAFTDNQEAYWS